MPTVDFTIAFADAGSVQVETGGTATGEQFEQLELVAFSAFVARQEALLGLLEAYEIDKELKALQSSPALLAALIERPPFVRGDADRIARGFRVHASCGEGFGFGAWSDTADDEAVWTARARDWELTFAVEPFGFSRFGAKTEKKHAVVSVLALLHELGQARDGNALALDRLAYIATEAAVHRYPDDPRPMAAFIGQMCWTGQFCPDCQTAVDRTRERCPGCGLVFRGDPSVVLNNDELRSEIRRTTDAGARPTLGTTLTLSDEEIRVDVTPLELADPAAPTGWWEEELRPIGVRLKVRNRGEETLDLLSVLDAQLIDQHGRVYQPHDTAELSPNFDEIDELDPGETVRAWIVFGLPPAATPAMFTYQPFVGETGVWTLSPLPAGAPAP